MCDTYMTVEEQDELLATIIEETVLCKKELLDNEDNNYVL